MTALDTALPTEKARFAEARTGDSRSVPLVVDLDGTLTSSDLLLESILVLMKRSLHWIVLLPIWLMRGRAAFKCELARRVDLDVAAVPLNAELVERLREEKARGRRLYLATGTHESWARKIADRLGLFEEVLATSETCNLTSHEKLAVLRERFGATGFDYAGNAVADYPIWRAARRATVVNASDRVERWAARNAKVECVLPRKPAGLSTYLRALRVHQWLKNLLVFVPLITSLQFTDAAAVTQLVIAFLSFSLCASSVYVLNDLADLNDDRQHPRKCKRPFAAGDLPLAQGFLLSPALLVAAGLLAIALPWQFAAALAGYYAMTLAYTFWLKRHEVVDVVALALLYTTRIFAGAAAIGISLSLWLVTFSIFIFLSLALAKRCAELFVQRQRGKADCLGRGYRVTDLPMLQCMGVGASYVAVLVLGLYLASPEVDVAYSRPELLWVFVPVLIYWATRLWLITYREEMHEDPVVFAARDRVSLSFGALCGAVILLAM